MRAFVRPHSIDRSSRIGRLSLNPLFNQKEVIDVEH